ncbi:hypothetical protein AAFF_G00036470 [Aldrovandia affinis]|uniref:Uncharacterized protein n=1 Tax=Aldrovandia affinis TaxID=143900 RepID=A0AAD7S3A7_9TELE|nr:hypothetical protein AAFF_G00036470 [Aldrovandia affinis]
MRICPPRQPQQLRRPPLSLLYPIWLRTAHRLPVQQASMAGIWTQMRHAAVVTSATGVSGGGGSPWQPQEDTAGPRSRSHPRERRPPIQEESWGPGGGQGSLTAPFFPMGQAHFSLSPPFKGLHWGKKDGPGTTGSGPGSLCQQGKKGISQKRLNEERKGPSVQLLEDKCSL